VVYRHWHRYRAFANRSPLSIRITQWQVGDGHGRKTSKAPEKKMEPLHRWWASILRGLG